ncbi:HAD family hydrolase [Sphingobacterium pedocola]|uniref:HAD family phosphatase n=1 Tax=Sphingobacterium pedocola TaxID=2082722 RepID=A0ABR9T4Y4_9SPHI|nr:HAD family phosphatase [Sphingobacterium pedocola]MBE8720395.1 HAD family phosphatase [Sphingobacterium pedocola]
MQKIKNIILDYGNVIFMIDFARLREAFISLGIKNVDDFFGHRGQDSLFDAFDKGEIGVHEFRKGIRDKAGKPELTDQQIDNAWNSLLIGVPKGTHELLLALKTKYRTFLLSNNNELHYTWCMNHLMTTYGVLDNSLFFEKTYYSHLMGKRKPNPDIFEAVLEENDLIPTETLFIDDSPQHLETAQICGMQTALCTKDESLAYWLEHYKLL